MWASIPTGRLLVASCVLLFATSARAQNSAIPDVPPPPPPVVKTEPPSPLVRGTWAAFAGTAAFTSAGAALFLSAESRRDDLENLVTFSDFQGVPLAYSGNVRNRYQKLEKEGKTLQTLAWVSFAAAGSLAVTGAVLFYLERRSKKSKRRTASTPTVTPILGPRGTGLAASWRF